MVALIPRLLQQCILNGTLLCLICFLFGDLSATLGLIAFALLILTCSYWKLSGYFESGESDLAENNGKNQGEPIKGLPDLE
ncbi:hypothetical protein AMTRI_Chr09g38330 [Amborella trichopoda]